MGVDPGVHVPPCVALNRPCLPVADARLRLGFFPVAMFAGAGTPGKGGKGDVRDVELHDMAIATLTDLLVAGKADSGVVAAMLAPLK